METFYQKNVADKKFQSCFLEALLLTFYFTSNYKLICCRSENRDVMQPIVFHLSPQNLQSLLRVCGPSQQHLLDAGGTAAVTLVSSPRRLAELSQLLWTKLLSFHGRNFSDSHNRILI